MKYRDVIGFVQSLDNSMEPKLLLEGVKNGKTLEIHSPTG